MTVDQSSIHGHGVAVLTGPDGKPKQEIHFKNLITQVGDQVYGERGAGVGSLPAPTGMRLGTGSTAAAKTGAGAAIVTYVSGSSKAFTTGTASSLNGNSRRITYVTQWAAGEATSSGIREVVVTNEASVTNVAGTAANTTARAVFGAAIDKQAGDTLTVTWHHDLLGA